MTHVYFASFIFCKTDTFYIAHYPLAVFFVSPIGEQIIVISVRVCVFVVCLFVCLFVCPRVGPTSPELTTCPVFISLWAYNLWAWLALPLAALRYVVYFRFYECH